jgi:hypothetical protein
VNAADLFGRRSGKDKDDISCNAGFLHQLDFGQEPRRGCKFNEVLCQWYTPFQ